MSTSAYAHRGTSRIGHLWGKTYHWTFSRKGRLSLHSGGVDDKCGRVHYNQAGQKQ